MTATIDTTGLHVQTQSEILEEIIVAFQSSLSLTAAQTQLLRDSVSGSLNQLVRIEAEREASLQDALLQVYNTLAFESEGTNLERVVRLLGVTRRPESFSTISASLEGTPTTSIPDGTRIQYDPTGAVYQVSGGPYVIEGDGSVEGLLVAEDPGALLVVFPDPSDWTILDFVSGFTNVTAIEQTVIGAATETDAELRERAAIEAYRRGQGPQAAIRAAVTQVTGVTYVGVWESQALAATDTDANGIPARSINVVVEGGDSDDIAEAIQASRAGGIRLFGLPGGTLVSTTIELSNGSPVLVQFNRVDEIEIYIDCEITTSTSEETAPAGVTTLVETTLLEAAAELFGIGDDVLPWKLEAAVHAAAIPGIDDVRVELSTVSIGAATRVKIPISIRERSTFLDTRTAVTEV